jgi:polynucleotide 5'-hydroxyl-kinase GRC3/NOL9
MKRTVEKNKTLLVDGPASVVLVSGKAEAFGATMTTAGRVVIREGKRLPFAVRETATFDISLGENAAAEEVDGDTVPPSWTTSCEELMRITAKPVVALVLGTVDSGKSSFCTYLANKALAEKRKVAIVDGDLGQSDIGPPCTVAYNQISKPITDLFNLQARNAIFIGVTSPSRVTGKVIEALLAMEKESLTGNPGLVIVNTDGWVEGECATNYKLELVKALGPQIIFCIQQKDELVPVCNALGDVHKIMVESPQTIRQRDTEKRKNLRELGYIKYLKGSKVQSLSLGWVKVEGSELFGLCQTHPGTRQASKIYSLLGMKPLHVAELNDRICVVIGRRRWIEGDRIKNLEEFTKKKVVVTRKGEEEGVFAGLYNTGRKFLGVGVLQEIDYLRNSLKVCTPVSGEIGTLVLGNVKLDRNMKELPAVADENAADFASFKKLF